MAGALRRSSCLLLLWCLATSGFAQPAMHDQLTTSPTSIDSALQNLQDSLQQLKTLLHERKIALQQANEQLTKLRQQLQDLQNRLAESQAATQQSIDSLTASRSKLTDLQKLYDEMLRMLNRWKAAAIVGWLLALIAALWAAVK